MPTIFAIMFRLVGPDIHNRTEDSFKDLMFFRGFTWEGVAKGKGKGKKKK